MTRAESWYNNVKKNYIIPFTDTVSENIPAIAAVASMVAVGIAVKTNMDNNDGIAASVEKNNQLLSIIEEKIGIAIEAPTIVKVELGDELEFFGVGDRTS